MVAAIQLRSSNLILWSRTKGNKWNLNECAADVTAVIVIVNPDFRSLCWATDGWKYSLKHRTGSWLDYPVVESHKKKGDRKILNGIYISVCVCGGGEARWKKTKRIGTEKKEKIWEWGECKEQEPEKYLSSSDINNTLLNIFYSSVDSSSRQTKYQTRHQIW